MKSTSGQYFIALDHVRALAAFAVFMWHFNHVEKGHLADPLLPPLSFLTEGHTGVAVFMTLSGYLFAKLLDGKSVDYPAFLYNRALRLLPLLTVVILLAGLKELVFGRSLTEYAATIAQGVLLPTLPNGGWSITVEAHFYLVLPVLLFLLRKNAVLLAGVLLLAVVTRAIVLAVHGQVHDLSYYTIVGRIDQFVLGIAAFHLRAIVMRRHAIAAAIACLFVVYFYAFDLAGGYYGMPSYPSPSWIWVVMPVIEGFCYATLIAWYETSFKHAPSFPSRLVALVGTYSYSIYLLHLFVVPRASRMIDESIIDRSNPYVALAIGACAFLVMIPIAHVSYTYLEKPFLKFRRPYTLPQAAA